MFLAVYASFSSSLSQSSTILHFHLSVHCPGRHFSLSFEDVEGVTLVSLRHHFLLVGFFSLAPMASIPLLCNICPKQPDFSDISHLLTHVASKGHLSHYFKAQVGGRQDENVRRRVETYTRWYDENGIEQLLSQRMASKDTRKATRSSKVTTQKAKGRSKPHRKKSKAEPPSEMRSPTKVEYTIDPQLANPMPSQDDMHNGLYCSPGQRSVLNSRRSFVPHMSDWQLEPDGQHLAGGRIALELGESMITSPREREEDLECFRDFLRSPTSTTYPDPTEQPNGSTFLISDMHGDVFSGVTSGESYEKSRDEHEGLIANPSPVLKGVKWPGMSIFDSASTDAQRLRNQKKADSVLGQMEHNSTAVEPVEVIYWPEGHLKKKRIITGNVESSPISEPTPRARRKSMFFGVRFLSLLQPRSFFSSANICLILVKDPCL